MKKTYIIYTKNKINKMALTGKDAEGFFKKVLNTGVAKNEQNQNGKGNILQAEDVKPI